MSLALTNVAPHFHQVQLGRATVWFSYNTPIGCATPTHTYTRENHWGTTTGRHLSHIDNGNKAARLSDAAFNRVLEQVIASGVVTL